MMWVVNYKNTLIFSHLLDPLLFCYNKDIIVNSYKLHFPSSHFSLKPNKRVFHPLTFQLLQPNTHKENQNFSIISIFHPPIFPLLQPNKA